MDDHSDLDLVIAIEPARAAAVMAARRDVAASLGPLLGAFTGEHVGEPRLLICLYDPLPLHVDLKFVALDDVASRVEDPAILWERDGRMTAALATRAAVYPGPDLAWIEERFWIWVHYAAVKIARGELLEAVGFLAYLRSTVLGPLALERAGATPAGVRRLESAAPVWADAVRETVSSCDAGSCWRALRASIRLYRALRSEPADGTGATGVTPTFQPPSDIERVVTAFVDRIAPQS